MGYTATMSQILSGSIFGDHSSPLSDTTLLSSVASRCDLFKHVTTQMPYALWVSLFAVLCGTAMVGNGVSSALALCVAVVVQSLCTLCVAAPVIAANGRFDVFTETALFLAKRIRKWRGKEIEDAMAEGDLDVLRQRTKAFAFEKGADADYLLRALAKCGLAKANSNESEPKVTAVAMQSMVGG